MPNYRYIGPDAEHHFPDLPFLHRSVTLNPGDVIELDEPLDPPHPLLEETDDEATYVSPAGQPVAVDTAVEAETAADEVDDQDEDLEDEDDDQEDPEPPSKPTGFGGFPNRTEED
jgi:hypothetical protein